MGRKPKRDKPAMSMFSLSTLAERNEKLHLRLRVENPAAPELQDAIGAILDTPPVVREGDTLNIDYKLQADYFGSVAKKLGGIIELAERGVAIEADVAELLHGKSLIVEVVRLLDKLPEYLPREGDKVELVGLPE